MPTHPPHHRDLTQEERDILLSCARQALSPERVREEIATVGKQSPRFTAPALVDAILWTRGVLRGSQFATGDSLPEAVYEAVVRASRDPRFVPLEESELADTRIELTCIQAPFMPLSPTAGSLDETKAYAVEYEGKLHWYVPAVFNCRSFQSLEHFLQHLVAEKIGSVPLGKHLSFYTAEVVDFIEAPQTRTALTLRGPVACTQGPVDLGAVVERALEHLLRNQEESGNVPPHQSPFLPHQSPFLPHQCDTVDWARLAHLTWALARVLPHTAYPHQQAYATCHDRAYAFLLQHEAVIDALPDSLRAYTRMYLARAARELGDSTREERCLEVVRATHPPHPDPLLEIERTLLELEAGELSPESKRSIVARAARLRDAFEASRETADLASYANLMNLFDRMGEQFDDGGYRAYARSLADWYTSTQQADGSFPQSVSNPYAYTRGTGKIIEALLSRGLLTDRSVVDRAGAWLASFQYTDESSYFIPCERQEAFCGGVRNSYRNAGVQIDAISHLLLAHRSLRESATERSLR
jgi:hypothetical protein